MKGSSLENKENLPYFSANKKGKDEHYVVLLSYSIDTVSES